MFFECLVFVRYWVRYKVEYDKIFFFGKIVILLKDFFEIGWEERR